MTATRCDRGCLDELKAGITKRIDAAWAEGDDAGGMATGSVAGDTEYNLVVIEQDDPSDLDIYWATGRYTCLWCVVADMVYKLGVGKYSGPCPRCGLFWCMPFELGPMHRFETLPWPR